MLILTRHVGETIMIGDDIRLTVTKIDGRFVRLGVAAPRQISIHREEVYERVQAESAGLGRGVMTEGQRL